MYKVDLWVWTDSRSQKQELKGYAYSIETKKADGRTHRVAEDHSMGSNAGAGMVGSWNKVVLSVIAEALERFNANAEVMIHSENRWVLNMIARNLSLWEEAGFIKSNGEEVANVEEWRRIARAGHSLKLRIDPIGFDRSLELQRKVFAEESSADS